MLHVAILGKYYNILIWFKMKTWFARKIPQIFQGVKDLRWRIKGWEGRKVHQNFLFNCYTLTSATLIFWDEKTLIFSPPLA